MLRSIDQPRQDPTTTDVGSGRTSPEPGVRGVLWIVAVFAAVPLWWSVRSAYVRITQPYPQSPWESAILVDAWRANHGMPVYELPERGHATHMYGPLITYLVAAVFRATASGFNLYVGRWIALISAAALSIGLAIALNRRRHWLFVFIAASVLFMQFYRARAYFAESRPDAISLLFSAVAVWMLYRGQTGRRWWIAGGVATMLIAFGFKQTAAAVAFVPLAFLAIHRPRPIARHLLVASIPLLAMLGTIVLMRVAQPAVYFYVVTVPTRFPIELRAVPLAAAVLVATNTLFAVGFVAWLIDRSTLGLPRPAAAWLLAAIVVAALASVASVAKQGGQINSYLPTFLAMNAFAILALPAVLRYLARKLKSHVSRAVAAAVVGGLILADATSVPGYKPWTTYMAGNGNRHYARVVGHVRTLPGMVICPDDPTLALQAKGYAGRCMACEVDDVGQEFQPQYAFDEWAKARYIVIVRGTWNTWINESQLRAAGYVPEDDPALRRTPYTLWRHADRLGSP